MRGGGIGKTKTEPRDKKHHVHRIASTLWKRVTSKAFEKQKGLEGKNLQWPVIHRSPLSTLRRDTNVGSATSWRRPIHCDKLSKMLKKTASRGVILVHEAEHTKVLCGSPTSPWAPLEILPNGHEVLKRLGHLEALDVQVSCMNPMLHPWAFHCTPTPVLFLRGHGQRTTAATTVRFALSDLVRMVRKLKVNPSTVKV